MIGSILTISDFAGQVYVDDARASWLHRGFTIISKDIEAALLDDSLDEYFMIALTMNQNSSYNFRKYVKLLRALTDAPIVLFPYEEAAKEDAVNALYEGATQMISLPADMQRVIDDCILLIHEYTRTKARNEKPLTLYADNKIFLNIGRYSANVDGREIELSKVEFDILRLLMEYRGNYLSYSQIYRHVWGEEYADSSPTLIHNKIKNLRKKLQWKDSLPQFIRTKRGVGYSFAPQHDQKSA